MEGTSLRDMGIGSSEFTVADSNFRSVSISSSIFEVVNRSSGVADSSSIGVLENPIFIVDSSGISGVLKSTDFGSVVHNTRVVINGFSFRIFGVAKRVSGVAGGSFIGVHDVRIAVPVAGEPRCLDSGVGIPKWVVTARA